MKTNIFIILLIIQMCLNCGGGQNTPTSELPSGIEIYYEHNSCPWTETGVVWYPPKDFIDGSLAKIALTDSCSLEFFDKLRLKSESDGKQNSFPCKIWFIAVVDYRTHTDTVSVSRYRVQYNNKGFHDSTAVFYYISKIQEEDSITFKALDESFYYDEFQPIPKEVYDKFFQETHGSNIELKNKIHELTNR